MIFRIVNGLMAILFAVAVAVQYNDPDPVRWMAIYGAACALSILAAARGRVPVWLPIIVGVIALAWGLDWSRDVHSFATYAHMFDSWEMKSGQVEEARETSGLLIVTFWMIVLALHSRFKARAGT